jgi:adenosylmethionine-8-amino-7-oxononanoate aminotransferase
MVLENGRWRGRTMSELQHTRTPRPRRRGDLGSERNGTGPFVIGADGRRYVDAVSNRSQIGYDHDEELAAAPATSAGDPLAALRAKLAAHAPGDLEHVFVTSGALEALEVTWSIARLHFDAIGQPRRRKAIVRDRSYHGVTFSALSFNGINPMSAPLAPSSIRVRQVSSTNAFRSPFAAGDPAFTASLIDELEQLIEAEGPDTIAIIVAEPVQMGGGCLVPPPGYWAALRELADRHGILLVADDSATGQGRLGAWYGFERFDVVPDMATCGTGLTSAYMPIGAVVVREPLAQTLSPRSRTLLRDGSAGGSRTGAAIAVRCLEIIEREGLVERVRALEPRFAAALDELRQIPGVGDVRGMGFFWAVELVAEPGAQRLDAATRDALLHEFLPDRLLAEGLLCRIDDRGDPAIMLSPPLICDAALLENLARQVGAVARDAGEFIAARGS